MASHALSGEMEPWVENWLKSGETLLEWTSILALKSCEIKQQHDRVIRMASHSLNSNRLRPGTKTKEQTTKTKRKGQGMCTGDPLSLQRYQDRLSPPITARPMLYLLVVAHVNQLSQCIQSTSLSLSTLK
jgi:hypothetical protein